MSNKRRVVLIVLDSMGCGDVAATIAELLDVAWHGAGESFAHSIVG